MAAAATSTLMAILSSGRPYPVATRETVVPTREIADGAGRLSSTVARAHEVLVGALREGGDNHGVRHVQVLGELKRRREA